MMLKDKFAIVTGASTGIGQAIAIILGSKGAFVALNGRSEKKLNETKKLIIDKGGESKIFKADLSQIDSIFDLIARIKNETNHVDILVNAAAIWHGESEVYAGIDFESFSVDVILDTYTVGTTAPTLLSHAFIPMMKNESKIINISGTFDRGAKGWLPYYVSKKAIEELTIGLSQELKEKNIQVNCISPSDTATEEYKKYFPEFIEKAIAPEEIAKYALFLCSKEAKNINGVIKVIKK